jgi:hypothetical protein
VPVFSFTRQKTNQPNKTKKPKEHSLLSNCGWVKIRASELVQLQRIENKTCQVLVAHTEILATWKSEIREDYGSRPAWANTS